MKRAAIFVWVTGAALVVSACAGTATTTSSTATTTTTSTSPPLGGPAGALVAQRLGAIDVAVADWRSAGTIDEANAAAEVAANLVVGPNGPNYGDRNGDGTIGGESDVGLLPGIDGTLPGLASALAANACVDADVLGGTWADPQSQWGEMQTAIDEWTPGNNTMPSLASHPMRIVGWATFTQNSNSLDLAHEYAGHAKLHVDISLRALDC
jgi:hypothetical protein